MAEVVVLRVPEVLKGPMLRELKFLSGVSDQVQAAESELLFMKAFLKDADARQEEHESIRIWVAKVRDAAYDLEDVIVSFAMKVAAKRGKGMRHSVKRYLGILREGIDAHKVGSEIEKITEDLSATRLQLQNYGIKEVNGTEYGGATSFMRLQEMRQTYPHVIEHGFVGLGKDEETLVECLVKKEKLSQVVSIWGMGGSGKTTLAKRVYDHAKVRGYFDRFAWVCVTQHCQSRKVWEEILTGLTSGTDELTQDISKMTNAEIVGKLCNIQLQRKCLVVLDDLWSCDAWKSLKSGFPVSAEIKSQILLTTRCSEVAPYADINGLNHKTRLLSEDESWELFERIVTRCTKSNLNSTKQKLGKQMLAHCQGLPLAITVLAGLLSKKIAVDEWTIVNKHVDVFVGRGMYEERAYKGDHHYAGVSWVLGLSYDSLPHHLKPCFLYLAAFPEDYVILVEPLTQLWIAEGFIEASAGKTVEDVAYECLIELERLCLVQVSRMDSFGRKVKSCRLHDLMRDMCILKATEVNFMHTSNFSRDTDTKPATVGKVRRLAIYWDEANYTYAPTKSEKHVRSLLYFHDRDRVRECKRYCDVNRTLFPSLAKKLKLLRVFKLEYMCQKLKVTSNVGELVHLRFLSLKGTHFSKLSSSFADWYAWKLWIFVV